MRAAPCEAGCREHVPTRVLARLCTAGGHRSGRPSTAGCSRLGSLSSARLSILCPRIPSSPTPAAPGALTILLDERHEFGSAEDLEGEERPHFVVRSLAEVQAVLERHVRLVPPAQPPQPLDD